ncbi:hypothetical protein DVF26_21110 [Salmonella enterica subsp. enterica]|nr:hypothetical protein [Salmonella enterica subsp. enterica]
MRVRTKIKKSWFQQLEKFPLSHYFDKHKWRKSVGAGNSNEDIIKDILKVDPLLLIETTFPLIQVYEEIVECNDYREIGDVDRHSNSFGVFFNGKFDGLTRLTGLDIEEYGVSCNEESDYKLVTLENEINDSKLNLSLHDYNRFTGNFSLIGNFQGVSEDYDILLYNKMYVKAKFWGLPSCISNPTWIEYLIDAAINYANSDYKMAALNYFSAYENFTSIIHDEFIFEHFARTALRTEDEFKNARNFSQNKKRLAAKSADVAKYLNLFNEDLKKVINKLNNYADNRNAIAHGSATSLNFDVVDMAYNILIYIYTIGYGINVLPDNWKCIINSKNVS